MDGKAKSFLLPSYKSIGMKRSILVLLYLVYLYVDIINAQVVKPTNYYNQTPPASIPQLFAPGVISDGLANRDFTISPDGNELFYTIQQKDFLASVILYARRENGTWSAPMVASFSGRYKDLEATFSPDGQRVYFSSNRPSSVNDTTDDFDIWFVTKENNVWSNPVRLDDHVNSPKDEFYPSVTKSGNLYFTLEMEQGKGKEDIVVCKWVNGAYQKPESLPEAINSKGYEFNAFVDPEEQFILFTGYRRSDDLGGGDLYISKKDASGNWLPAVHLPAPVNSNKIDYCPFVSWDKKYMFFTSSRVSAALPFKEKKNLEEIKTIFTSSGNAVDDIYWVSFDAIIK